MPQRSSRPFRRARWAVALLMLASPLVEVQDDYLTLVRLNDAPGSETVSSPGQTDTEHNWMDEISLYPPARISTTSMLRLLAAWTAGRLNTRCAPERGCSFGGDNLHGEPGLNQLDASSYRAPLLL